MLEAAHDPGSRADGRRGSLDPAVRAAYLAFVLWIPIETIDLLGTQGDSKVVSLSRGLGLLLIGLALVDWRRCFRRIPLTFWLVSWYVAAYSASQLWLPAELDELFFKKQVLLIYGAFLFLISANLFRDPDFRAQALRVYSSWITVVGAALLAGAVGGLELEAVGRRSISGQDPNQAAGLFAAGALCLAGDPRLLASSRPALRLLGALGACGVLTLAILRTGSRGGLLAFGAGILGLLLCAGKATRKRRTLIMAIVTLGLAGLILREFRQGSSTALRLADSWTRGDTAGRVAIYEAAWALFRERPLLGHGGTSNIFKLGIDLNYGGGVRDTHNLLLALLTEVGLVGAVPFILALLAALWKAWQYGRLRGDPVPFALLCMLLTINMTVTGTNQNLFWIVLAAGVACGLELEEAP